MGGGARAPPPQLRNPSNSNRKELWLVGSDERTDQPAALSFHSSSAELGGVGVELARAPRYAPLR